MQQLTTSIRLIVSLFFTGAAALAHLPSAAGQFSIDTDFEGASARVVEVDQEHNLIHIMPGGDPEHGWPAWWCFRVRNLSTDQPLEVRVTSSGRVLPPGRPGAGKPLSPSWALPTRAAWSTDGHQWQQTSDGTRQNNHISYQLSAPEPQLWISWGPMATPSQVASWLEGIAAKSPCANAFALATSRAGLAVRGLHVASAAASEQQRPVVWFQARQHAWESGSSWVARGVMDWVTSDHEDAIWLREHAEIFIVPIMDVDRCASGDGGKESVPHDHNRDWSDTPHYPEVAAVQERVRQWVAQNRLAAFIDLHNPGPSAQDAFFFVAPEEIMNEQSTTQRSRFLDTVKSLWNSPIPLDRQIRSTGPTYHPLWNQISTNWAAGLAHDNTVSVCLETCWNTPHSTTGGYRRTGASLAAGTARFLRQTSTGK